MNTNSRTRLPGNLELSDIQIWPCRSGSKVKAMAAVVLAGKLRVSGLRIIEGANGLFVAWPGEKKQDSDQWFHIVHPLDRELGDVMQQVILERFRVVVSQAA